MAKSRQMNYSNRQAAYEKIKIQIARESKTQQEYERRIKALLKKLNL